MTISRISIVACVWLAGAHAIAEVVVEPAVIDAVASGPTIVVVELDLVSGLTPEGELTSEGVERQREGIRAAQELVLSELTRDEAELVRRPQTAPYLTLKVTSAGLAKLRAMPERVTRVFAERSAAQQLH